MAATEIRTTPSSEASQEPGPHPVITEAITAVAAGEDLTVDQARAALDVIMTGQSSSVQTAGLLVGLRTKGESVDEIVGLAQAMRAHATKVNVAGDDLVDTAGTGGGVPTFNVSTTAALVAAGAGCRVAKHGNRSATGLSGSADLLEALGANIQLTPEAVSQCIEQVGFGFMFAPAYHAAMKHVVPVRKALAVPTIFNLLGPLTNPAGALNQVVGVSDRAYLGKLAQALAALGAKRALVVSGDEGCDEISASGATHAIEITDGLLTHRELRPSEFGLDPVDGTNFTGADPTANAQITRRVLAGEPGPERTLTVVNAAAAIYVAGRAESLEAAARSAEAAIDSGAAASTLDDFVALTLTENS